MKPPHLLLTLGLAACGNQDEACDDSAVYSLTVRVFDANEAPLQNATVTYSVDGSAEAACDAFDKTTFGCGIETAGEFFVTVSLPGYRDETTTVTVSEGVCHVFSREVLVVLQPVTCSEDPVAAVVATVESASGAALTGVAVSSLAAGAESRAACVEELGSWACALDDLSGSFDVFASADGLDEVSAHATVAADADGCHPVTEAVTLTFP